MGADPLTATFAALADPTRRAILARLAGGEATVLEKAGLISRSKDAQWRPCRIETGALERLDGWVGTYRRLWQGKFDRMDAYLAEIQKGKPHGPRQ